MLRSERKILGSLLRRIRLTYLDVWHDLKYETQHGPEFSDFPHFPAALELQAGATAAIGSLDEAEKDVLVRAWRARPRLIELRTRDEILNQYGTILLDYVVSTARGAGARTDFDR
jgi:hypothetical protein